MEYSKDACQVSQKVGHPATHPVGEMPRQYHGPLREWERSAKVPDLCTRWSVVDHGPCSEKQCFEPLCKCQPCPLCTERVPYYDLQCKHPEMGGIWLGPHCTRCDYLFFMTMADQLEWSQKLGKWVRRQPQPGVASQLLADASLRTGTRDQLDGGHARLCNTYDAP